MRPDKRFSGLDEVFWANVRTISERLGYTIRVRGKKRSAAVDQGTGADPSSVPKLERIKAHTIDDMVSAMHALGLSSRHLYDTAVGAPTRLGSTLSEYFAYRAQVLDSEVQGLLMDASEAKETFHLWKERLKPTVPTPMNKQKGDKKDFAFLTGLVNMFIEAHCDGMACSYSPGQLTAFTRDGSPFRTLARRVDGCFPSNVNPMAVWEIKEYYYTTTFGSRVADGVYETLLDGFELRDVRKSGGFPVRHLLMVDGRYTWWDCGRSYLCRLIDMLHMGYVDEVLFGREVVDRMPKIVQAWVAAARSRHSG